MFFLSFIGVVVPNINIFFNRPLAAKNQDELKALQLCQSKVRAKKLPMEVIDAEYQWYVSSYRGGACFYLLQHLCGYACDYITVVIITIAGNAFIF
jgi:hypothetical protein